MNQPQKAPIQGIYEVCIGTTDPLPLIQYWQQFGYRIGSIGDLSAPVADQLYQVNSSLRSIRLYHQGADHGLIRLMVWEKPLNQGLQMTSMKVLGNRWATTLTADLMTLWNHAQKAIDVGMPVKYLPPQWTVIYEAVQAKPFLDPIIGVREMLLLQPLTRQVLFQRFNYDVPNYGQIHPMAFFKTSQATHLGMIIQDDSQEVLKFYDEVLGLLRVQDNLPSTYETSTGGKLIFELQPDEELFVTAFDDPRSSLHWQDGR
ncbi:MAG TPA: bleomycin resistance protein, partial [Cyanothece sp. UBA12306]|nr:bleomycin resistance protein [Cyanothece sp. UBA12306]